MFKLSELFVSISAKDDELKRQLGGVKDSISTVANSIKGVMGQASGAFGAFGSAAKGVWTSITGHVGEFSTQAKAASGGVGALGVALGTALGGGAISIISKLTEGVFDFVKETVSGSDELTEAWEGVKTTFSELLSSVTGVGGTLKEQLTAWATPAITVGIEFVTHYLQIVKGMVELAKPYIDAAKEGFMSIVEKSKPYFDAFAAGVGVVFQNIGIAIQAGVEHFDRVKTAVLAMTTPVVAWLQKIPEAVSAAFGGTSLSTLTQWGQAVKEWVIDKVELAGLFIRNWPDFLDIAAIQMYEKIINIGEYFATIPENAKLIGDYIANNWRALIVDALDATARGFQNLGENIGRLAVSIKEFFEGKGWHFDFKPLLEGFKATAQALPEMVKPALTDMSGQVEEKLNQIAERERNRKPFALEVKEKKKVAEDVAAKQAEQTAAFKSHTLGAADLRTNILQGIYSGGKDDVPKQQLKTQERIAKATEKVAEHADKAKPAVLGP